VTALNIQYANDASEGIESGVSDNTFFVRRAEVYVKGRLKEGIEYEVEYDLAPEKALLRAAYIDLLYPDHLLVRMGQFRIPFGIEIQTSSKRLPFINRMLISSPNNEQESSKGITSVPSGIIQERDIGVRISGGRSPISYALAVINGSDKNTPDKNGHKDVVSRVALASLKGLTLGSSAYWGRGPMQDARRERLGGDLTYRPSDAFWVQGEYVVGRDVSTKLTGYSMFAVYRFVQQIEATLRYEGLDPNTQASANELRRTTLGVNYYLSGNTRYQLNYEWRDDQAKPGLGNMALMQFQLNF